jgi:hypothetical protein
MQPLVGLPARKNCTHAKPAFSKKQPISVVFSKQERLCGSAARGYPERYMEFIPETISNEALLAALDCPDRDPFAEGSLYHTQLRHRLLTLARKARLEVAAHQLTGLPPEVICAKTALELMSMLDESKGQLSPGESDPFRHW